MTKSVEDLERAVKGGDSDQIEAGQQQFLIECKDPLSDWLDSLYGNTVMDNGIFNSLPNHWEKEFHKDMDALNVSEMIFNH